jgi:hypothetical protein
MHSRLLAPVIALVLWSFVMCAWLYATRIPAIRKLGIVYDPQRPADEFHAQLPAAVRWKADNYNNLMEQPTLFYAVALTLAVLGADAGPDTALAWLYVALRVAHSLVQATINAVMLRFALFMAATLVLLALTIRAALIVF